MSGDARKAPSVQEGSVIAVC